ncbi:hypothetical protein [Staphylococcus gallinarum]|uniref:hypothetical protein n=1 Tax=Staphylococcus gallinarum TaxID=1293 RepID=UPI001E444FE7|nr:hypothetical protein [Staphylococcus gallinarum]MCD8845146.1 hypothetical protein [Staphylococcus gallinarum]
MKQISVEKYIPKKHQDKVLDFYRDIDGCWLELKPNYISTNTGVSTIHEDNIKDVKKQLKTIVNIDVKE